MATNLGDPFDVVLELTQALLAELRMNNVERFGMRQALQKIVDLKQGGEAEMIARQALQDFVIVDHRYALRQVGHPVIDVQQLFS